MDRGFTGLTRREFLKGAGAAAIGLTLSGILPKKVVSQASGCPEYRGIAPVDCDYDNDSYQYMRPFYDRWLDEIKELGADAVEVNMPIKARPDGTIGYNTYEAPYFLPADDDQGSAENIKSYVRQAQEKGFKVILDIPSLGHDEPYTEFTCSIHELYQNLEDFILMWAEIAEELGVEGYCPEGEFAFELPLYRRPCRVRPNGDVACPTPILAAWIKQLIPKVRERYSGNIIIQENPYDYPDIDFDGADYIGLHLHVQEDEHFIPGRTTQRFRQHVRNEIEAAQQAARRDNIGVMITEASFGCIDEWGLGCPNLTQVNEQQQKELCEVFFEEVWGKTDGIFLWEWGDEPQFRHRLAVTSKPAEQVVNRYYQSC